MLNHSTNIPFQAALSSRQLLQRRWGEPKPAALCSGEQRLPGVSVRSWQFSAFAHVTSGSIVSWIFAGTSVDGSSCNETFPEVSISHALFPLSLWFSKGTSDKKLFKYLSLNKWAAEVFNIRERAMGFPDIDLVLFCCDFYGILITFFCSLLKLSKK